MSNKPTDYTISVVLGNYNGRRFLTTCLSSLENQSYSNLETIFVDDESTDGSAQFVSQNFPHVMVIRNPGPERGFAACCDAGARIARADYLLFLNVDIELEPDCLSHLVARMDGDPSIGVCGPRLLSLNDRKRIVSTGGFLDVFGFGMDRGLDELDTGRFSKAEQVSFITGAVILVRRSALKAAGGWDIDTFTYAEDSDLCWRVLLNGYKVVYEPKSVAFHFHSPSMGRASPRKIHFMERNRLSAMIRNYSLPTLLEVLPGWAVIAAARILYFTARRRADIVDASIRAYIEVLQNLPKTFRKRALTQMSRRIPDKEIMRHFAKESLEARLLLSHKLRMAPNNTDTTQMSASSSGPAQVDGLRNSSEETERLSLLGFALLAVSFLLLSAIFVWENLRFGVFGSGLMVGWDTPNYVFLANELSKNGPLITVSTWSYPQLYVQLLSAVGYLVGNVTLAERAIPLAFAFLSVYAAFLITLRMSGHVGIAGLSSILQVTSISFLKIVSDNNRSMMAFSLTLVAMLVVQAAWTRGPRSKEYLALTGLAAVVAITQFETFAILSLTLVVCALLTWNKQNILLSTVAVGLPSISLATLFPSYFVTYFQTPIQSPKQILSTADLTYWIGGSALLLLIFAAGCVYAFMRWRTSGNILNLLVLVWSTTLLAIYGGVLAGFLGVQAEFGVRALLLVPWYILIPIGIMLAWTTTLQMLRTIKLPTTRLNPKVIATSLAVALMLVIVFANGVFLAAQSPVYFDTFVPATTYNQIALATNYVRENGLGVPIIVFDGSYAHADLYRSYFGALVGEHFAYYGDLNSLLELKPTLSNSTDPYQYAWENYLSRSYLQELVGNSPSPSEFIHQSHITNITDLASHPLILITPSLYDSPLPPGIANFSLGLGAYVVPPGGSTYLEKPTFTPEVTLSRDGKVVNLQGTYTSIDSLNQNNRFLTVNASRGFESYNVTSFPSDWKFLEIEQGGDPSALDFSPMRPNRVPAVVGNDYADSVRNWTTVPGHSRVVVDYVDKMEGEGSLRVDGTGDYLGNLGSILSFSPTDYSQYNTVSFWAKCLSCSSLTVNIVDNAQRARTFYDVEAAVGGVTSQYKRFSVSINAPTGGDLGFDLHSVAAISFLAHSGTQSTITLWIDDVVIENVIPNQGFLYKGRVLRIDEVQFRFEEILQSTAPAGVPATLPVLFYPPAFDLISLTATTAIFLLAVGLIHFRRIERNLRRRD